MTRYNPFKGRDKILLGFSLLILLSCYRLFSTTVGGCRRHPKKAGRVNIFILGGQSNMAGRGGVVDREWDGHMPVECTADPRILRLNQDLLVEEAEEPLHEGIDVNKTCGVGPGMAFGNAVLEKDPNFGDIILVPCAVGGTSIREWSTSNSSLRRQMVERSNEAVKYGGKIRAILWYQGEKDTETEAASRAFAGEYQVFLRRLFEDLNYPEVAFVQVALASGQGEPDWLEKVRSTQIAMKNVVTVDGLGLEVEADGLHLTTGAQVRLGRMLADAFFNAVSY